MHASILYAEESKKWLNQQYQKKEVEFSAGWSLELNTSLKKTGKGKKEPDNNRKVHLSE